MSVGFNQQGNDRMWIDNDVFKVFVYVNNKQDKINYKCTPIVINTTNDIVKSTRLCFTRMKSPFWPDTTYSQLSVEHLGRRTPQESLFSFIGK